MKNQTDFIVRNRQQVINHLMLLIKEKCLINLHIGQNESFITTLMAIDSDNNTLLFDYGPKEYLNKQLPDAARITFRTVFSGIKISFEGCEIKKSRFNNEAAFSMPIPDSLLWLQRRQFYRVKSPLSKNSYLKLIVEDEPIQLHLYDISLTGIAVINDSDSINRILSPSRTFNDCQLILDGIGEGAIGLEVLNQIPLNPNKPDKTQKIGCKFTAISPAFESAVQRYMQQIERDLKHKN